MKTSARINLVTSLTVVSMVLGFLVAVQYRQSQSSGTSGSAAVLLNDPQQKRLLAELNAVRANSSAVQRQLARVSAQLTAYEAKSAGTSAQMKRMEKRLQSERILSGITPVTGPGVAVTLMDGQGANTEQVLTHDWDVRQVINELFTAGSEAVSINGYRVVSTSGIYCTGPVVRINNHRIGAPFLIEAIGDPTALSSALDITGGILDSLRARGVNASPPQTERTITMPAFAG